MIIRCVAVIVALAVLCGGRAEAAQPSFRGIIWPRHDRTTGIVDWELRAETAQPTIANDQYVCTRPELTIYKVVNEKGHLSTRKDLVLKAESGTYVHGSEKSFAKLDGRVVAHIYEDEEDKRKKEGEERGQGVTTLTTSDATVQSTWDKATGTKTRVMNTQARVVMKTTSPTVIGEAAKGPSRELIGKGATINQKTTKDGKGDKSTVTIHKNITMVIRGAVAADSLPVVPGATGAQEKPAGEPVTITCLGPLTIDRLINSVDFQKQVALRRGATTLHCDELMLQFPPPKPKKVLTEKEKEERKERRRRKREEEQAGGKPKPEKPEDAEREEDSGLQNMLAQGNVAVIGKDQQFSGSRFAWTPKSGLGVLTGNPARMTAPGTRARADKIEFDQRTQSVKYTGKAVVEIELKPE